ncbi:MAG: hypothetical protein Kow0089_18410 [Desulfobulbaceae bacterium]
MKRIILLFMLLQSLAACAQVQKSWDREDMLLYTPTANGDSLLIQYAPIFVVEHPQEEYNRIGTPRARLIEEENEHIFVDTNRPIMYTEIRQFQTEKNVYTNLVYRIHFPRTPWRLVPFEIGAGRNVGLLVIITLDSHERPLLYTTVHTCGCYLAFVPTSNLPQSAFPKNWPEENQTVFSEILPSLLRLDRPYLDESDVVLFPLRDGSHRIMDIRLDKREHLAGYPTEPIFLQPLSSLEHLPLAGSTTTTSFYETEGFRAGYVKDSHKPLELLLMSWWALDLRIGEDKRLSRNKDEPPVFFTSLKPWARDLSDMRDFPTFLKYWGWDL